MCCSCNTASVYRIKRFSYACGTIMLHGKFEVLPHIASSPFMLAWMLKAVMAMKRLQADSVVTGTFSVQGILNMACKGSRSREIQLRSCVLRLMFCSVR